MASVSAAAVSRVQPTMAARRLPLVENPNAANSPVRQPAAAAALKVTSKRPRPVDADQKDYAYALQPAAKRQMLDGAENLGARGVALPRRPSATAPQTELMKKLEAAQHRMLRQQQQQQQQEADRMDAQPSAEEPSRQKEWRAAGKTEAEKEAHQTKVRAARKTAESNIESIRQWQQHYRKLFPSLVFYFDKVPPEQYARCVDRIRMLGAREERFFSKAVTHVVTTRAIPAETPVDAADDNQKATRSGAHTIASTAAAQPRTIDPSLLSRNGDAQGHGQARGKFTFEMAAPRKGAPAQADVVNTRRPQPVNNDVLHKAREMNMKIWALEKLQRILTTIFHSTSDRTAESKNKDRAATRNDDLNQMLQQEKLNGPADRDSSVMTGDMVQLTGFYVYIHDMDEKTKPIAVREYAKDPQKNEPKWPTLRDTGAGKCPFVEDQNHTRERERQLERQKRRAAGADAVVVEGDAGGAEKQDPPENAAPLSKIPRTRSISATRTAVQQDAAQSKESRVLVEVDNVGQRPTAAHVEQSPAKPLDPPKIIPHKRTASNNSLPPLFNPSQLNRRIPSRLIAHEPVASGVQPSNITSAIQSQMISSTAAVPGARAGTSKELNQLKRKVLERNGGPTVNSNPSSYLTEVRAAINQDRPMPQRAAKMKAQETLAGIQEDMTPEQQAAVKAKVEAARKKRAAAGKELKPGYCENCRDKFDDFDTHVQSRKHRKFAISNENWAELDQLLGQLERPLLNQNKGRTASSHI